MRQWIDREFLLRIFTVPNLQDRLDDPMFRERNESTQASSLSSKHKMHSTICLSQIQAGSIPISGTAPTSDSFVFQGSLGRFCCGFGAAQLRLMSILFRLAS